MPGDPASRRWFERGQWALLLAAATVPFAPTLGGWFTADDLIIVEGFRREFPSLPGFLVAAFVENFGNTGAFYRPLAYLSLWADLRFGDWSAPVAHGVNLALHAATSLVLFAVLRRLGGGQGPALLVAAIAFAASPRRVEAVAWAACRPDLLCAFLAMLATYVALRSTRGPRHPLVATLWLGAVLAKESALLLPAVLMLLRPSRPADRGRRLWRDALPLTAAAAVYLVARRAVLGEWIGGYGASVLLAPVAAASNVPKLLLYPVLPPLEPLNEVLASPAVSRAALAAGGALALGIAIACLAAWRLPVVRFGAAWWAAAMIPVASLPIALSSPMNDRLLYLPAIGLVAALSGASTRWSATGRQLVAAGVVLAVAHTAAMAARWPAAGRMTERLLRDLQERIRDVPASCPVYVAMQPDSYRGAYMLRSGLPAGLRMMGASEASSLRVHPLSLYLLEAPDRAPVRAGIRGDPLRITLASVGAADAVIVALEAGGAAEVSAAPVFDRYGRRASAEITPRAPGLVVALEPTGVTVLGGACPPVP
jgi:hypothetical protein